MRINLTPGEIKTRRLVKRFVVLFIIFVLILHSVQITQSTKILKSNGYVNLVDVGSYKLNVAKFGTPVGNHRIIMLSDLSHGDLSVGAARLTEALKPTNQVVFVDRAGYGMSDDTFRVLTVQRVVEDYRAALQASGVKTPYVLVAEEFGGVYATYWETTYPGEIEAVIFINGTEMHASEAVNRKNDKEPHAINLATSLAAKLGWAEYVAPDEFHRYTGSHSYEEQEMGTGLIASTVDSLAPVVESIKKWDNIEKTFAAITHNNIPKLYISTDPKHSHKVPKPSTAGSSDFGDVVTVTEDTPPSDILTPYLDKIGNCRLTYLNATNYPYRSNPKECSNIIQSFINNLDQYASRPAN